jgi:hypothetical protein
MKYLELPCPTCQFPHQFKRQCWYETDKGAIASYTTDDMKSRKECKQELVYGVGDYNHVNPILNKGFKE